MKLSEQEKARLAEDGGFGERLRQFMQKDCTCHHEPWQHSTRTGCVVGPDNDRCPCKAVWKEVRL